MTNPEDPSTAIILQEFACSKRTDSDLASDMRARLRRI